MNPVRRWLSEIKPIYHRYARSRNLQIVPLEISSQDWVSILVSSENQWQATYRMVYGKPHFFLICQSKLISSALISASVGSESYILLSLMGSYGYVSYFIEVDIGHALCCTSCIDRSCEFHLFDRVRADNQVFYGRYLRKLSNLTQEAVGEMSKVRSQPANGYQSWLPDGRGKVECVQDCYRLQLPTYGRQHLL